MQHVKIQSYVWGADPRLQIKVYIKKKIIILFFQLKSLLIVGAQKNVTMRRFFCAPKNAMLKMTDKKISQLYAQKVSLIWTYGRYKKFVI